MAYVYLACTILVTIFSTGGKFQILWSYTLKPVLNFIKVSRELSLQVPNARLDLFSGNTLCSTVVALFPGPTQLSGTSGTEKWGERAWYLFSREHNVIEKWWKYAEQLHFVYCSTDYMLNTWCVRQSLPTS